ncbi:MAG: threonylcarbamoyl-AMP synthase [Lachnospiraceae bacterium]|nr:threonylcarbamoyl-AMP synthase [Lachnospiraceae bacterium]
METIIRKIDAADMNAADFAEAAEILRNGGLVAFPTETVYGLGGDATNPEASAKIYAAKGRPSDNPLIVHIADEADLEKICDTGNHGYHGDDTEQINKAHLLARHFWPGPLTMILPKGDMIPGQTTGGLDTVAVRFPSHPVAQAMIRAAGIPIAAPSANLSGRPSTTRAEHVIEDLNGRVDMIIDSGSSDIGLESTIVDLTCSPPLVLRPGYISIEELRTVLPDIEYDKAIISKTADPNIRPKAPGMKYRHYAPKGDLTVFEGTAGAVINAINKAVEDRKAEGYSTGVMASEEFADRYVCDNIKILGSREHEEEIAAHLFDVLRSFDTDGTAYIFGECFTDGNLSAAIMNRLIKAAGYHIIKV